MHITFSLFHEGSPFSDKAASLGELRTGPAGLISLLSNHLGLVFPEVSSAERIRSYRSRLEEGIRNDTSWSTWYGESFSADPWSTSRQLLQRRDDLYMNGWDGSPLEPVTARLATIIALESSDIPLSPCRGEQLLEVISLLKSIFGTYTCDIKSVTMMEPDHLVPGHWKKLFYLLQVRGVLFYRNRCEPTLPPSITLIKAQDTFDAATFISRYLSSCPEQNNTVTLVVEQQSRELDQEFHRMGLPAIAKNDPSPDRSVLQIVPLFLSLLWEASDIYLLSEFLTLPVSPVPYFAARKLLLALTQESGWGGRCWKSALEEIAGHDKGDAALAQRLDSLFHKEKFNPDEGVPAGKLIERCRWAMEQLTSYLGSDPSISTVIHHFNQITKLCTESRHLPRIELERIIESVIGSGFTSSDRKLEAGNYLVASHPAEVSHDCETLVWWKFISTGDPESIHWDATELEALQPGGYQPESSLLRQERYKHHFFTALGHCKKKLLLVLPRFDELEETEIHPLYHELKACSQKSITEVSTEDLTDAEGRWQCAGRSLQLVKLDKHPGSRIEAEKEIQADSTIKPKALSFTQMSSLISCPMQWAMRYWIGLSSSKMYQIPTGGRMLGLFIHRIVEELYREQTAPLRPEEVAGLSGSLFDQLLPQMASELLLPGKSVDLARYRSAFIRGITAFNNLLISYKLSPRFQEKKITAEVRGIPFRGTIDFLLESDNGEWFIVDFKWTGSSKRQKEAIESGTALQLAVYTWLLRRDNPSESVHNQHAGFFMLAQAEILSDSPILGKRQLNAERDIYSHWHEIWNRGEESCFSSLEEIGNGRLLANGVRELLLQESENLSDNALKEIMIEEAEGVDGIYLKPGCTFCDYSILCGYKEGSNE
jgi:ATP-dependent helicase/nuclease subunit B